MIVGGRWALAKTFATTKWIILTDTLNIFKFFKPLLTPNRKNPMHLSKNYKKVLNTKKKIFIVTSKLAFQSSFWLVCNTFSMSILLNLLICADLRPKVINHNKKIIAFNCPECERPKNLREKGQSLKIIHMGKPKFQPQSTHSWNW